MRECVLCAWLYVQVAALAVMPNLFHSDSPSETFVSIAFLNLEVRSCIHEYAVDFSVAYLVPR